MCWFYRYHSCCCTHQFFLSLQVQLVIFVERFWDIQYSLASFLFAVFLLAVPPFVKVGGTCLLSLPPPLPYGVSAGDYVILKIIYMCFTNWMVYWCYVVVFRHFIRKTHTKWSSRWRNAWREMILYVTSIEVTSIQPCPFSLSCSLSQEQMMYDRPIS